MVHALALEAASESCSVTLVSGSSRQTLVANEPRSHSQHFLPLIQQLLQDAELSLDELDFIACGNGPGSFTGLRICFSVAQGLAYGAQKPLLTVNSLESMAYQVQQLPNKSFDQAIAVLDARMGEVYLGRFDLSIGTVTVKEELQLLSVEQAQTLLGGVLTEHARGYALVGSGLPLLDLPKHLCEQAVFDERIAPHSSAVAELALRSWLSGSAPSAAVAEICYLRNSVSWDKRKRIRS